MSEVQIFPAHDAKGLLPPGKKYTALYDTGATHSAISPQVVSDLNLASIGARNVSVAGGVLPTTTHLVNILLPNRVMFPMLQVSKTVLAGIDVLIGMDILGVGDFAVTHLGGNTTFSYCIPARRGIDFVAEIEADLKPQPKRAEPTTGRNDACTCGSGKKYKKCCGSAKAASAL